MQYSRLLPSPVFYGRLVNFSFTLLVHDLRRRPTTQPERWVGLSPLRRPTTCWPKKITSAADRNDDELSNISGTLHYADSDVICYFRQLVSCLFLFLFHSEAVCQNKRVLNPIDTVSTVKLTSGQVKVKSKYVIPKPIFDFIFDENRNVWFWLSPFYTYLQLKCSWPWTWPSE